MAENASQITVKIANQEFCGTNTNRTGMKYDPFAWILFDKNVSSIIVTYKKYVNILSIFNKNFNLWRFFPPPKPFLNSK